MIEHEIQVVNIESPGEEQTIKLSIVYENECIVSVNSGPMAGISDKADNLFDAMYALRQKMDGNGWLLLCNVARPNAAVSSLYRNMNSRSQSIYLLKLGEPASTESMIEMFDPAPYDVVDSAMAQKSFYSKWLRSLD